MLDDYNRQDIDWVVANIMPDLEGKPVTPQAAFAARLETIAAHCSRRELAEKLRAIKLPLQLQDILLLCETLDLTAAQRELALKQFQEGTVIKLPDSHLGETTYTASFEPWTSGADWEPTSSSIDSAAEVAAFLWNSPDLDEDQEVGLDIPRQSLDRLVAKVCKNCLKLQAMFTPLRELTSKTLVYIAILIGGL